MLTMVPAPLLRRCWKAGLYAVKGAIEGNIHDFAPVGVAHLGERLFPPQRRIVDEDIQAAKVLERRVSHRLHGCGIGDIADMNQCLAAPPLDIAGDGFSLATVAARIDQNGGTAVRQRQRDRAADIAAGAGDDGGLATEFVVASHGLLSAQR